MVERTVAGIGAIDVLVNSAGDREIIPFLDLPFAEWQRVIATNLTGTFLFAQASARKMVAQGKGGKIVNLSSVAGVTAVPNRAAYVSSKHAVVGLTKELALELADRGIQVNAVAPGVVETALTAPYFDKADVVAAVKRAHPVGRWGQPEEIAGLILYLASKDADFITGATFLIDGGYCASIRQRWLVSRDYGSFRSDSGATHGRGGRGVLGNRGYRGKNHVQGGAFSGVWIGAVSRSPVSSDIEPF